MKTHAFFLCIFTVVLLLLGFMASAKPAQAATITVTSTGDGSANPANCPGVSCRLRDAVAAATPGDTIAFDTALFSTARTITLTAPITITKNLAIDASTVFTPTVSGNNLSRVFTVNSGMKAALDHLVIASGNCGSGCTGGGIYNTGTLTVTNSTLSGNSANYGGGIYNAGALTVTNTTFSGNSASYGGGIFNNGTLNVSSSTFFSNTVTTGYGGGIGNYGTLTATNTTFSSNSASNNGGGIGNYGALSVSNTTFFSNTATVYGGGIFNYGTLTATNTTFSGNSATLLGGGIINYGTLTATNTTFSGNSATFGGGIINYGMLNVSSSTFFSNTAPSGGGIYNTTTLTVTNTTFSGNSASSGGGIYNSGGTTTLKNTIVTNSPSGGNCRGTITNGGYNLDSSSTCSWGSSGGSMSSTDPLLAPLADNGGPTLTFALLADSQAIDAGTNSGCPSTDQRGFHRPADGDANGTATCDIGAYEKWLDVYLPLIMKQ